MMNLRRNFADGLLQDCGNTSLIACETMFVLNLAGANCFSSSSENLTFFAQYPSKGVSPIPFPHILSHTRGKLLAYQSRLGKLQAYSKVKIADYIIDNWMGNIINSTAATYKYS